MNPYRHQLEIERMKLVIQQSMVEAEDALSLRPGGIIRVRDPSAISYVKYRGMSANCVNCGAPPEQSTTVCSYCGSQERQ